MENNIDQQEQPQDPMTPSPEKKSSGPGGVIAIIIIVVILLIAGIYLVKTRLAEPTAQDIHESQDPATEALAEQGQSDQIADIEEDLQNTELENLDTELESIERELDAALSEEPQVQ